MKNIKKMILALVSLCCLGACSKNSSDGKLKVVATIFPEYDWVISILGDKAADANVTMLLDNGVDLHSYNPSVQDMAKLSDADVFIHVGGESDEWVEDALKAVKNKNMKVVNLLEVLGDRVKEEEIVEGMEHEHHHEGEDEHHHEGENEHHHEGEDELHHEGEDEHHHEGKDEHHHEGEDEHHHEGEDEHHHHEHEGERDEHVWLSLKNAQILCAAINDALCAADKEHADIYRANLAAYTRELAALDAAYAKVISSAGKKTLLFGDRFPFRYLVDDYGLSYYAAFAGCSAETEASFKTIAFLSAKLDELTLPAVCKIESGDGKIAETLIKNSKTKAAKILTLDSMQSTTSKQVADGASYLNIMAENLQVLKEALQ
ncbi:MAG: zinc ABC transporter substrate-binding protein [Treponema sp.]|nr:zinc ABC transporter substrate-binding protein [Treponema sp.]